MTIKQVFNELALQIQSMNNRDKCSINLFETIISRVDKSYSKKTIDKYVTKLKQLI